MDDDERLRTQITIWLIISGIISTLSHFVCLYWELYTIFEANFCSLVFFSIFSSMPRSQMQYYLIQTTALCVLLLLFFDKNHLNSAKCSSYILYNMCALCMCLFHFVSVHLHVSMCLCVHKWLRLGVGDLFPYIFTTTELFTIERTARAKKAWMREKQMEKTARTTSTTTNWVYSILMNLHVCSGRKNRTHMYWRFLTSHMQYIVSSFSWFFFMYSMEESAAPTT